MPRATETERINVNVYIDKTVGCRLHKFAQQQGMWKGRVFEAAIIEYLNKIERKGGTTFNLSAVNPSL